MSITRIHVVSGPLFNGRMTIDEIRRANLRILADEAGGVMSLAEKLNKDPSQVSQWRNASKDSKTGKPRGMRSATCREIEAALGKPPGWMDVDHSVEGQGAPEAWPFGIARRDSYDRLRDEDRIELEHMVSRFIAGRIAEYQLEEIEGNNAVIRKDERTTTGRTMDTLRQRVEAVKAIAQGSQPHGLAEGTGGKGR